MIEEDLAENKEAERAGPVEREDAVDDVAHAQRSERGRRRLGARRRLHGAIVARGSAGACLLGSRF